MSHHTIDTQPRFTHDCDQCKYLGQIQDDISYDLYYCPQGGHHPTVLARFGNEGPDYKSGAFRGTRDVVLAEAMSRAEQKGYQFNS